MFRRGHDLVRYLTISRVILGTRVQYADAFLDAEARGDVTYFVRYHLRIHEAALHNLATWIGEKRAERVRSDAALHRFAGLNLRQRLAMSDTLQREGVGFTANGWAHRFDVTHQTAMADLRDLVELGLLGCVKVGREHWFQAAPGPR